MALRKIFIDSQSYPLLAKGGLEEQQYEQRCLLEAEAEDLVVLSMPPEDVYLDYLRHGLGWELPTIKTTYASGWNLAEKVLADAETFALLNRQIATWKKQGHAIRLESYAVTPLEHHLAKKLGVPLYGFPESLLGYGTKSGFRKLASAHDLPVPDGFEYLTTVTDIRKAVTKLAENHDSVLLKQDDGLAGIGILPLLGESILSGNSDQTLNDIPIAGNSFVAEAYIPWQFSFSFQIEISSARTFSQILLEQLVHNGKFIGCQYPLENTLRQGIQERAWELVQILARQRCRGHFNMEGIVSIDDGSVYFVELNARKTGVTYPLACAKRLTGGIVPPFLAKHIQLQSVRSTAQALKKLEPILYIRGKQAGVVPYNTGLLPWKQMEVLCVAPSAQETQTLYKTAQKLLGAQVPN